MKVRGIRAWTARLLAGAAMACVAGPAFAQDDEFDAEMAGFESELYCVSDVLSQSGDFYTIAGAWVDPDATEAAVDAADVVLSEAVDSCASAYEWDEKAQEYGALVGIHGSVVETLTGEMISQGLTEEQVSAVFDVLDAMSDEDIELFKHAAWAADPKFTKRTYRALVRSGVPNEDIALENAMHVLESSVLTAGTIVDWLDMKSSLVATAPDTPAPRGDKSNKSGRSTPRPPKLELAGSGTGWYVAPDGYLVTNAHVVEQCKVISLKSGAELELVDIELDEDLALLKGPSSVAHLSIRDGRNVRLAEDVLVAGYPLGGILSSGINVTIGTVSALAGLGDDERRFQFTAPVQPGNSGGPVLDMSGHVIGVVVAKLNAMSVQEQIGDIPQNVNFGIGLKSLTAFLKANDVAYEPDVVAKPMDKVDLAEIARDSTVLIQCYQ
jgi:S1-C subfamily serine protease